MSTRSCAVRITSFSTGSKIQPTGFKVYIPTRFYTSCPSLCTLATFSTQLHCTQLHCTQTLPVAVQKLYTKPHPIKCTIYACMIYVAVPGRNRTLFRCIFQSQYRVRSAVTQYFRYGWGSYSLCTCKHINTQHVWVLHLTEVLHYSALNTVMRSKYNVRFLPGTATYRIALILRGSLILQISRIWNRLRNYFSENFTFLLQPLLLC